MHGQLRDMLAGENDDDCLLRAMAVRSGSTNVLKQIVHVLQRELSQTY